MSACVLTAIQAVISRGENTVGELIEDVVETGSEMEIKYKKR